MMDLSAVVRNGRVTWERIDGAIDGPNERCIEVPLALEVLRLGDPGWVLDAGCAMNGHLYVMTEPQAHVVHLTQAIASEKKRAEGREPISYVSADLRDLHIFADGAFNRTVCISTLEHVGMDNSGYGGPVESDPLSVWRAVAELLRVTRGELLITVPYAGAPWTDPRGRHRFWTAEDLTRLVCMARDVEARFYVRGEDGWQELTDVPPEGSDPVRCIAALRVHGAE